MKYPKLKNTVICAIICLLPMFVIPIALLLLILFDNKYVAVAVFVIYCLVSVAWLSKCLFVMMDIDMIVDHKRARLWYYCSKNGTDAETIKSRILRRVRRFGRKKECIESGITPIQFNYHTEYSYGNFQRMSAYEKALVVFETDYLTQNVYNNFLNVANSNIIKVRKHDLKSARNLYALRGIIILTDYMDDAIPDLINVNNSRHDTIVCVVELSTNRYFVDTRNKGCIGLISKYVFGGFIPRKGNDNFLPNEQYIDELCETPLWDAIFKNGSFFKYHESRSLSRKRRRVLRELKSGEITIFDEDIYIRIGSHLAWFITDKNELEPDVLIVYVEQKPSWYNEFGSLIPKKELDYILERIERFVKSQGKKVRFVDPDDEELFE